MGMCKTAVIPGDCSLCGPGVPCINGACSCEGRGELCSVLCVDKQQAVISCGTCFAACKTAGSACRSGACKCAPGEKECGNACKPVLADPANCGDCGKACAAGQKCENGSCVAACTLDTTNACKDNRCWDVKNDRDHCGASCKHCDLTQSCVQGVCTDFTRDPLHCGSCSKACAIGETCKNSQCVCQGGLALCGTVCGPGSHCANGACTTNACPMLQKDCDGAFCLAGDNPRHCGGCTTVCAAGKQCLDGQCATIVPAVGCTTCPCDYCDFDKNFQCCVQDGKPMCIAGQRCPK